MKISFISSRRACYALGALLSFDQVTTSSGMDVFPTPSGEYVTGVQDFEIVDTVYPIVNETEDANGRRLLVRAWNGMPLVSPGSRTSSWQGS